MIPLSEEQYPIAFDALIMRIKDPITLTTTVDTINYDDASAQAQSIPAAMRTQLKEKQNKLKNMLQLNPTRDNPWDEVTAAHILDARCNKHMLRCSANGAHDRR
jgi:hypothetical protein